MFPSFSSFPPDSVPHPRFWNIFFGSILYHPKEFKFFRCLQLSRILGMSSDSSTMLLVACFVGRLEGGFASSSMARRPFGTSTPTSSWTGRPSSLSMRWCCAACARCPESGDCRCGGRLMISMLSVSHFLGRGHFKREFHKELSHNFVEPCAVYWILFTKLERCHRSWQSCRSRRLCAMVMSFLRTIVRPTRRGAWIGRNYSCISHRNCCKTNKTGTDLDLKKELFVHLLLTKSILGLPEWICSGYRGVGDIRPGCLFYWSDPSVSWTPGFVGAAKLGIRA